MKTKVFLVLVVVLMALLFTACGEQKMTAEQWEATQVAAAREAQVNELIAQANAPSPTEVYQPEATTVPAAPAPTLVAQTCDTPSIKTSLDGQTFAENGEYLKTNLGERMTRTTRLDLVPTKAWNDPLTPAELKLVEQTWVSFQICVPEGLTGRIFAGGFEQGTSRYENGVLLTLTPGLYEFKIRNAEVVIWYPNQDTFAEQDLTRIIEQIRNGNFDIHSPLAFFGVTTDLLPLVPADLVKLNNVQIVPDVEPIVK